MFRAACLAFILLGCGDEADPGADPASRDCAEESLPPTPQPVADVITLGVGEPADFRAYPEGETFELVHGPQDGWMVTPAVRIDGQRLGTDGACAYLDVEAEFDSREPVRLHLRVPESQPSERYWFFWGIPLLLSFDVEELEGLPCTITATFFDDGKQASSAVSGHLGEAP